MSILINLIPKLFFFHFFFHFFFFLKRTMVGSLLLLKHLFLCVFFVKASLGEAMLNYI